MNIVQMLNINFYTFVKLLVSFFIAKESQGGINTAVLQCIMLQQKQCINSTITLQLLPTKLCQITHLSLIMISVYMFNFNSLRVMDR